MVGRVTTEGDLEQKKKKKDEEKEKKVKKGRVTKISDVSDEDADGGGWEAVKGGITTMVVSDCYTAVYCTVFSLFTLSRVSYNIWSLLYLTYCPLTNCFIHWTDR